MFNYLPYERWFRYWARINDERKVATNAKNNRLKLEEDLKCLASDPSNKNDGDKLLDETQEQKIQRIRKEQSQKSLHLSESLRLRKGIKKLKKEEDQALQKLDDLIEVQQKTIGFWLSFIFSASALVISINTKITSNQNSNKSSIESLPSRVVPFTKA